MHDSLISNTVIVSDTDSDTDNEYAIRISFSTSGSQCMVTITAVGLSNKYLNRPIGPICFEMLVLRFLSRRSNETWKPVIVAV